MARLLNIRLRRGTSAAWASANPVLDDGEIAFDKTTRDLVVGDGSTAFASLPKAGSGTYVRATMVDAFRQGGDPDDTAAWQRAVASAISTGSKLILAQSSSYTMSGAVDVSGLSGVTLAGVSMHGTVVRFLGSGVSNGTVIGSGFINSTGSVSRLTFRDMTIKGTVVDDVTVSAPRRSRTNSGGAGIDTAISILATRAGATRPGTASDVRLLRMRFEAINNLPFILDGVTGYAAAYDVETYNTKDGSWLFCEHVVFDSLRSIKSHDNGFSISRSNLKVTGGSVEVRGCFDYGVFASGFVVAGDANDAGPQNVVIDSVNVQYAGQGGVKLDDGPQGVVLGNVYVNTVTRGGTDIPTDSGGIGILIGGNPATPTRAASPTVFASGIVIGNALLIGCQRGGILISGGAKDVTIGDVTILDPGSQFLADGTTSIGTGDQNNNFGIAVAASFAASVSNVWVRSARVVDRRGTPYGNRAIDFSTATGCGYSQLSVSGMRVTVDTDSTDDTYTGLKTFRKRIKSSAPTATVAAGAAATTAAAASSGCNDMCGTVNATSLASPVAGILAVITFGDTTYPTLPRVIITPCNVAGSAACRPYVTNRSTTGFSIACATAPASSEALQFDYHVLT